jgi:hypothetical protein
VIRLAMARCIGRHVGHDHVGLPHPKPREAAREHRRPGSRLGELDAGDRLHVQEVDRRDRAATCRTPNAGCGDLRPAPRRRAEIDDAGAGFQEAVTVVEFDQLVGRSRAIAVALRLRDVRIVDWRCSQAREDGVRLEDLRTC